MPAGFGSSPTIISADSASGRLHLRRFASGGPDLPQRDDRGDRGAGRRLGAGCVRCAFATQIGAPYWLLALIAMLPWLATWILMRRWMDGRLGWGFWGAHAGFLAAGLILPMVTFGLVIVSQPTMPAEVRRQLTRREHALP
jgi:hypothetical protein